MKKVVVFGSAGFLGTYLINELLKRKYQVISADIKPDRFNQENFVFCDILNKEQVSDAIAEDVDIVYNLAGFANLDKAILYPYETMNLNVLGNINILNECHKKGVAHFVYASSAYAMSNKGSFYGISKLASEKIIEEYNKKYNLQFTILRYGSVYSELPFDNNYIYGLVEKAVKDKKIIHKGDGQELREYIHASDAAKLSVDILEDDKFKNEHVILTGTEKMRRLELFQMIKEILNDEVDISLKAEGYNHHYKFTPYSFEPTVSKKLVANPHIDMGQGILECIRSVHRNAQRETESY